MYVNTCVGCGRPLGLKAPVECYCWRTVNHKATVPVRVRNLQKKVATLYRAMEADGNQSRYENHVVLARHINNSIRLQGEAA